MLGDSAFASGESTLASSWSYLSNTDDRRLSAIANTGLVSGHYSNYGFTTTPENFISGIGKSSDATAVYAYDELGRLWIRCSLGDEMEHKYDVKLSAAELEYLKRHLSQNEALLGLPVARSGPSGNGVAISLSRTDMERLRDRLTVLLAATGFEPDYSPSQDGRMLEELIDKLCRTRDAS